MCYLTIKIDKLLLFIGIIASATFIVLAARGDLWLDEIWSLKFVEMAHSPSEIFTSFQHDNNHLLNTFYLYFLGQKDTLILYRMLSVFMGIGAILLLSLTAGSYGNFERVCIVYLAGLSYPLILYFSEARGYAAAIFFAIASYELLKRIWVRATPVKRVLFWLATMLGSLSHSTFIIVLSALIITSIAHLIIRGISVKDRIRDFFDLYFVPIFFQTFLYMRYIRNMEIGGGPVYSTMTVINEIISTGWGFYPPQAPLSLFLDMFFITLIILGIWLCYREKQLDWVFFFMVLLVSPCMFLLINKPRFLYFRYFLICLPFFYLLLSHVLGVWYRSFVRWRVIIILLITLLVISHADNIISLLLNGRGHYRQALNDMAAATNGQIISVASDHDFGNKMVLDFYARFLDPSKYLRYITRDHLKEAQPEWMISHNQDLNWNSPQQLQVEGVAKPYSLFRIYTYSGISGWNWYIYRQGK